MFPQCGNPARLPRSPSKGEPWTERIQAGGLDVAASPPPLRRGGGAPRLGRRPAGASGTGSARSCTTSPRATASCSRAATSCSAASTTGTASTPAAPTRTPTPPSCARSATCSTSRRTSSSRPPASTTRWPRIAGPQLVVPLLNARFATNAVNARWGSLYDALYGTDVIAARRRPGAGRRRTTRSRGDEVIARGRAFLDEHFPLASGSHADATSYAVDDDGLAVTVKDDVVRAGRPRAARRLPRRRRTPPRPSLLVHHDLHVEIQVDPEDSIGADRRGRGQGPPARVGGLHDHGPRGLGRRRRRRRQGARLPQLAAPRWRAPSPRRSPRAATTFTRSMNPDRTYTAPVRRRRHAARPVAAVHPPGRPPDDHRRGARPRRQRGARGHPRRTHDRARQPAATCAATRRWPTPAPARCTS